MRIPQTPCVLALAFLVLGAAIATDARADRWSISLKRVVITDPQESSGDEPYFAVIGFRSTFGRRGSTRTFWNRHLDKVGDDMKQNQSASIHASMGMVDIGTVNNPNGPLEIFGAILIAMEKDRTPWGTIYGMFDDVELALQRELRRLVETDSLNILSPGNQISDAVNRVRNAVTPSVFQAIGIWLSSLTDPDDIISVQQLIVPVVNFPVPGMFPFVETGFNVAFSTSGVRWDVQGALEKQDEPWTYAGHRGYGFYVGDFNGDGADDIFRQVDQWGGAEVMLSNGVDRFFSPRTWTGAGARGYGWKVGDFNGDGKDDIFRQVNQWGGAEVFLSTGSAFNYAGMWTGAGHRGYGWYVGDFDGDGDDDIFRQVNEWGGAEVFLAHRGAFNYISRYTGAGHRGHGFYVGDFDGDGDDDIFRQVNEWGGAEVFRCQYFTFAAPSRWIGAGHRGYGWYVGDFNGDGKADIFRQMNQWGGAEVFLSTGASFYADYL